MTFLDQVTPLPDDVKHRLDREIWIQSHGACPVCKTTGNIRKDGTRWSCYHCDAELNIKDLEILHPECRAEKVEEVNIK